ncbi:MAG: hypothetical protein IKT40_10620 [Bacilli bacterium]|nr:hypothetical protein [Bacilli bacterium]
MTYNYLVIITLQEVKPIENMDILYLNNPFIFIDENHIQINDEIIEFEYLIYSNKIDVNFTDESMLLMENNIPVTNFFYQTTKENIYYITEENLEEKINEIIYNE